VKQWARAFLRSQFPGLGMGNRQFLGQVANGLGLNAWSAQKGVEDVDLDIVPTAQSSNPALAGWAFLLGLPSGAGAGQYGLLVPTLASGGVGLLTGVKATVYPQGAAAAPAGAVVWQRDQRARRDVEDRDLVGRRRKDHDHARHAAHPLGCASDG
jgi:hypothetical protein